MRKKVLVLGAGLVARPLVRYLLEHDYYLIIATRTVSKAIKLLDGHPNGRALPLDLTDAEGLDDLIKEADLAISLVPYSFHVQVARRCIAFDTPMVTTSYVSNEMRELNGEAEAKGLIILNETGVDPGIDHMSAMRIIHGVQNKGGKVVSFRSYCGGLPAPEANNNPWGYKFSWSPRGVLLAGRNSARFLQDDKLREIGAEELFATTWPVPVEGVGELETYPNRDSMQYLGLYGLKGISTMFRGTLRYPGWCRLLKGLVDLGWLALEPPPKRAGTLGEVTRFLVKAPADASTDELKQRVAEFIGVDKDSETISRMAWAGLFGDEPAAQADTILDVLGERLLTGLSYAPGERDMLVMLHEFEARTADGAAQRITSTMVDFGVPGGDSSMSRTVSLPAAIGARLILEGKLTATGVRIPVDPDIYNPILNELENMGIVCKEKFD